jgi:dTDP-4-dehydrorhamnose reductase
VKILLIGSGGRLGKELLRALDPCGELVCCVRPGSRLPLDAALNRREWRLADLADVDSLRALVRGVHPKLIVNAAAYTAVEAAEREPSDAAAVNAIAPGVLAEEAASIGAALVHFSTDYVFGGQGNRPWREEDPANPINVYGQTKLAGEEAIRASGASHLIVRTSWLYASHGQSFVKKMFDLAACQDEIVMIDDQIGAPTSARFVADVTAHAIAQAQADPAGFFRARGGTLHVACAGETSWYAYAREIFHQARDLGLSVSIPAIRPIPSAARPSPIRRPLNSRLDTSRLRARFSVSPPPWEVELKSHLPELFAQYVRDTTAGSE